MQKGKYYMILFIRCSQNRKIHKDRLQNGGLLELGRGENGELLFNGYRSSVLGDEKFPEMDSGDGCTTMQMQSMPLNCRHKHVKMVNFMLYMYFTTVKEEGELEELTYVQQQTMGSLIYFISQPCWARIYSPFQKSPDADGAT